MWGTSTPSSFCFATCLFSRLPPPPAKPALSDLSPEATGKQAAPTTQGAPQRCHLLVDNEEAVWHLCLEPGSPGSPGLFCPAGARWNRFPHPQSSFSTFKAPGKASGAGKAHRHDSKQRNSLSSSSHAARELASFPGWSPLSCSVLFCLVLDASLPQTSQLPNGATAESCWGCPQGAETSPGIRR